MKPVLRIARLTALLLLVCTLIAAPAPPAVAAVGAQDSWEPGSYSGWVYLLARLIKGHHTNQEGVKFDQDTAVFWQTHGDLEVKAEAGGQGEVNYYLPVEVTAQENGQFQTAAGSCTFNIAANGQADLHSIASLGPAPLGKIFDRGIFMPKITARVTNKDIQGQCENMVQTALFIEDTLKNTTSKILGLKFKVGYRTPLSVGGTCEITDWKLTMPIGYGTLEREMLDCQWRVFRQP